MTFKPGAPGRPIGSVNKISTRFAETMRKHGVDVAQELLDRYNDARNEKDTHLAVRILIEMAQYVYPKLKSTEHNMSNPADGMGLEEKIDNLKKLLVILEAEKNGK